PARTVGNGGHGIAGMQARALAVGGEVTAAPRADGGFRVHARFPLAVPEAAAVGAGAVPGEPGR
ncbi:sensor histidine kinase, partial [Nocardia sp. NPDC004750]